jgi:hypothetical protein
MIEAVHFRLAASVLEHLLFASVYPETPREDVFIPREGVQLLSHRERTPFS